MRSGERESQRFQFPVAGVEANLRLLGRRFLGEGNRLQYLDVIEIPAGDRSPMNELAHIY